MTRRTARSRRGGLFSKTFAALGVRNFRLFFVGQLISVSGVWMQSVALGWLVLQVTGSSTDLGLVVALQFVPMLLIGPYGGLVADRNKKRRVLFVTQSLEGVLALASGLVVSTHHANIQVLFLISTLLGVLNLFDNPARQSFVQEMVGPDLTANAVSLNSVLINAGRLIGPGIAAVLIASWGTAASFYINAATFIPFILGLALMHERDFTSMRTITKEKGQVRLGLHYVHSEPLLRGVIVGVALVGTFTYNYTVTLPLFARLTFHSVTASNYGRMMAAVGLGAVLGGLIVAYRSRPTTHLLASVALGLGAMLGLVSQMPTFTWAEICLVPTGALSISFITTANSFLQTHSIQEMRGRVMSLYALAWLGTTPIGAPLTGVIIHFTNPRVGILMGSLVTFATGLYLLRVSGRHRSLEVSTSVAQL